MEALTLCCEDALELLHEFYKTENMEPNRAPQVRTCRTDIQVTRREFPSRDSRIDSRPLLCCSYQGDEDT